MGMEPDQVRVHVAMQTAENLNISRSCLKLKARVRPRLRFSKGRATMTGHIIRGRLERNPTSPLDAYPYF